MLLLGGFGLGGTCNRDPQEPSRSRINATGDLARLAHWAAASTKTTKAERSHSASSVRPGAELAANDVEKVVLFTDKPGPTSTNNRSVHLVSLPRTICKPASSTLPMWSPFVDMRQAVSLGQGRAHEQTTRMVCKSVCRIVCS